MLETIPLPARQHVVSTGTDSKTGHQLSTLAKFLAHFSSVSPNNTKRAARDLYKQYVEYYVKMGYQVQALMTEKAFGRETKKNPGIFKERTSTAVFNTLDHAAIQRLGHRI